MINDIRRFIIIHHRIIFNSFLIIFFVATNFIIMFYIMEENNTENLKYTNNYNTLLVENINDINSLKSNSNINNIYKK